VQVIFCVPQTLNIVSLIYIVLKLWLSINIVILSLGEDNFIALIHLQTSYFYSRNYYTRPPCDLPKECQLLCTGGDQLRACLKIRPQKYVKYAMTTFKKNDDAFVCCG
jgi:hypothetical protein